MTAGTDTASVRQPLRVLIVDDEPHNRARLVALLARADGVTIAGEAADGVEAVDAVRALAPDLVFLDVQMPGMSGLDVVTAVGADRMPVTVFVTAYDRYAIAAFDAEAVDYLLKPFDDERFGRALARARRAVAERASSATGVPPGPTASVVTTSPAPATYLARIAVEVAGQVRGVPVETIDYITASGVYAQLHAGGRRHIVRESMQALEVRLDPARFLRVHRSAIVQLARVDSLRRLPGGDGEVRLIGGTRLRVSRTRRERLEQWLAGADLPR